MRLVPWSYSCFREPLCEKHMHTSYLLLDYSAMHRGCGKYDASTYTTASLLTDW